MKKIRNGKIQENYIVIIISLILQILLIKFLSIKIHETILSIDGYIPFRLVVLCGLWVSFVYSIIVFTIGTLLGRIKITFEKIKLKTNNQYIYYRELPNEYGIGVATLLMDSTLETEKDIVATILNLCAKGYLTLNKNFDETYNISIIKKIDEKLLQNERYVMDAIIRKQISELNYQEWFECCKNDCIRLGLIEQEEKNEKKKESNGKIKKANTWDQRSEVIYKKIRKIIFVIGFIVYVLCVIASISELSETNVIMTEIFLSFFRYVLICTGISLSIMVLGTLGFIIKRFILLIIEIIKGGVEDTKDVYQVEVAKYLKPTKLGIEEIQKLKAFKAFINDFGYFASKNPEEIVLWEYYLSYAQVFGLTDKILATGYDQIIKNGSFNIDGISQIRLNNIRLSN